MHRIDDDVPQLVLIPREFVAFENLDEISFDASERTEREITIDAEYVRKHIGDLADNADLSKFIL